MVIFHCYVSLTDTFADRFADISDVYGCVVHVVPSTFDNGESFFNFYRPDILLS